MKNLKKFIAIIAAAAMTFSLAACSAEKTTTSSNKKETKESASKDKNGDLFDVSRYKSDKDKSEWTIAVVT